MKDYSTPERIIDLLALLGIGVLISIAWKETETILYGFSQASLVDSVFAVLFSLLTVAGLRTWALIKREEV